MSDLHKPERTPDFTVLTDAGSPCWEFFIEEKLQYNVYDKRTYQFRALSDNTLEWRRINANSWYKYDNTKVNVAYIRYLEDEEVNNILLENE